MPEQHSSVVRWAGRSGVVHGVQVSRLVELAERHDTRLELLVPVGAGVYRGMAVARAHGGRTPSAGEVARAFDVGRERNLYQDPAYGLRQLVDVASRALSPGVNDPTTGLQALDRVAELLAMAAVRPDPTGRYVGADGTCRLTRPVPTFAALVDVGLTEITFYGATAPQITRRLAAALDVLDDAVGDDEGRRAVLEAHRRLLAEQVDLAEPGPELRRRLLVPDLRGLG